MADRERSASEKFDCSTRERAIFESGIKMGTIYHQFVGTPVNSDNAGSLEKAIEDAVRVQPYVKDVTVKIDQSSLPARKDVYSYVSLSGDMIDAAVTIEIEGTTVRSEMRYDKELGYPLMYVAKIEEK